VFSFLEADSFAVSEAIALEIVNYNGGSYRGAQLFVGFMYIGAAMFVWLVRGWKIGRLEEKAAELGISTVKLDSVIAKETMASGGEEAKVKVKSSFVRRMFKWQRV